MQILPFMTFIAGFQGSIEDDGSRPDNRANRGEKEVWA